MSSINERIARVRIRNTIQDCAEARDERGRWRKEKALERLLLEWGDTPAIAAWTASAARTIGGAIAKWSR